MCMYVCMCVCYTQLYSTAYYIQPTSFISEGEWGSVANGNKTEEAPLSNRTPLLFLFGEEKLTEVVGGVVDLREGTGEELQEADLRFSVELEIA